MVEKTVLFWTFIGIFSLTAVVTLLGITGVLKSIKERYLNVLFTSLILEVVAAVLILFKSTDFTSEHQADYSSLIQKAGYSPTMAGDDQESFILSKLTESKTNASAKQQKDSIANLLEQAKQSLAACEGEVSQLDKSFFTKITRLRKLMYDYGGFITLNYQESGKKEVYPLVASIFETLQMVASEKDLYSENGEVINDEVKRLYNQYKRSYINLPENKVQQYYIIFQSDIAKILRDYLNLINE
jgi:hypothetical protein